MAYREIEEMSSTTVEEDRCFTPTSTITTIDEEKLKEILRQLARPPVPGGCYIVHDPETNLAMAVERGELCLVPLAPNPNNTAQYHNSSIHWYCVENPHRWYGFQNRASGKYISYNKQGTFVAEEAAYTKSGHFQVRQHRGGEGYMLFVRRESWVDVWLDALIIGKDRSTLVMAEHGRDGTSWEFMHVRWETLRLYR